MLLVMGSKESVETKRIVYERTADTAFVSNLFTRCASVGNVPTSRGNVHVLVLVWNQPRPVDQ